MLIRKVWMGALPMLLAGLASACAGETEVASHSDELHGAALTRADITIRRHGDFDVSGCSARAFFDVGVTQGHLNFIAADLVDADDLDLELFGIDDAGVLSRIEGISARRIDAEILTRIRRDLDVDLGDFDGVSDLELDAMIPTLGPSMISSLRSLMPGLSGQSDALRAALRLAVTADITENALVFTGLDDIDVDRVIVGARLRTMPRQVGRLSLLASNADGLLRGARFHMPFASACGVGSIAPVCAAGVCVPSGLFITPAISPVVNGCAMTGRFNLISMRDDIDFVVLESRIGSQIGLGLSSIGRLGALSPLGLTARVGDTAALARVRSAINLDGIDMLDDDVLDDIIDELDDERILDIGFGLGLTVDELDVLRGDELRFRNAMRLGTNLALNVGTGSSLHVFPMLSQSITARRLSLDLEIDAIDTDVDLDRSTGLLNVFAIGALRTAGRATFSPILPNVCAAGALH